MKYYIFIFITFILSSCDVSTISDEDAKDISKFKVSILIEDGTKDNSLNSIKVRFGDGKRQIINKKIQILLNGFPLELFVKKELYYTTTSYYRTDSLLRKDSYYFEIILPDSTKYPLGFIQPSKESVNVQFNIPKTTSVNEDFVFTWTALKAPYELNILKGIELKKKRAENITDHTYERRRLDTLNTQTGEYILPQSYFEDSLSITRHLEIELSREESGLMNSKLRKSSVIIYNHKIEKTIDVEE